MRACSGRGCLSAPVTHSRTPVNARNLDKVLAPELAAARLGSERAGAAVSALASAGPTGLSERPDAAVWPVQPATPESRAQPAQRTPSLTSGGSAGPEVGAERRGLNMAAGPRAWARPSGTRPPRPVRPRLRPSGPAPRSLSPQPQGEAPPPAAALRGPHIQDLSAWRAHHLPRGNRRVPRLEET